MGSEEVTEVILKKPRSERVLLTGAGFTHNFGGPLAKELWAFIFNNDQLQNNKRLREYLLQQFDFESVYFKVMNSSEWDENEKEILAGAVSAAYERIDEVVRVWIYTKDAPYPINEYGVRELIQRFSGNKSNPGFIFTLNQDLFIERKYRGEERPKIPGVPNNPRWFSADTQQPLTTTDICQLPTEETLDKEKDTLFTGSNFYYVKLHGSQNWVASDGNHRMVIGRDKENQINREPLLRVFLSKFNQVLCQGGSRLLVIGYGFGDEHINHVIANAIQKHELRIYVLSPTPIDIFSESMISGVKSIIYNALHGYNCCDLLSMFPADQSETSYKRVLYEQIFG